MSYRFIFLLFTLLYVTSSWAQTVNLVPNPSFEERELCIWNDGTPEDAPPWFNPWTNTISSPDVFHVCTIVNEDPCPIPKSYNVNQWAYGVPTNFQGCEEPHTGEGYAGIYLYAPGFKPEYSYREYLAVKLDEVLTEGQWYEVSFYISLADRFSLAVWAFQVAFLDSAYSTNHYHAFLPFTPQLTHTTGDFVTNYEGWQKIEWMYLAQGNERYMYIGNFQSNAEINTLNVSDPDLQLTPHSYYFIDDVFVGFPTETSSGSIESAASQVKVYPNPAQDFIHVEIANSEPADFIVWEYTGRTLLAGSLANQHNTINLETLSTGLYVLEIEGNSGLRSTLKIIKR